MTCLLLSVVIPASESQAQAQDDYDCRSQTLLSLINEARRAPLEMAASLGLDPGQVLADLPGLEDVLLNGLPGLNMDSRLVEAAALHNQDMLDRNYYSAVSPEGETVSDRISAAGYEAQIAGETLAMLSIMNFMDPDQAVRHLFDNIFLDELNPARIEPRYILNPVISEVGIDVAPGVKNMAGFNFNVYQATCDFTGGELSQADLERMAGQLEILINQARVKPAAAALALGLDLADCTMTYPELLNEGTAPLVNENALEQADVVLTVDVPVSDCAVSEAASVLFKKIMAIEAENFCADSSIFTPDLDSIAVELSRVSLINQDGGSGWYYRATIDLAKNSGRENPILLGVVYNDDDNDGLYSPGEGLADRPVIYFDAGVHLLTDGLGRVESPVEPGWYLVILHSRTEKMPIIEKNVENQNVWFDIDISRQ